MLEPPTTACIEPAGKRLSYVRLETRRSAELLSGKALEQTNIEVAHSTRDLGRQRRDIRFRPVRGARVHERLVVPDLAVVLSNEFLAQLDLLALLVGFEVPESILVRRPERVDEHQLAVRVHRELLLPVDVDEPSGFDVRIQSVVDFPYGLHQRLE